MLQQQDDNKQLQQEINKLQEKNRQQKNLIQGLQPAKLQRLRQQLKQMKNKLQASKRMLRQHVAVQEHLTAEKRRATAERLKLLKANKNMQKLRRKIENLTQQVQGLTEIINYVHSAEERGMYPFQVREENNRFSDNMRRTLLDLQGIGNVSASKCGTVIKAVAKNLFNTDIADKDIPCLQTALNVADEGHVLAKYQAAEKMLSVDNFTFHSDGTSRNGMKIVGHQISLDSGETLSLGLATVATEDASTLLEITVQLLEEITDIYSSDKSEDEKNQVFHSLLSNLTSVMSDRASVMKCFDRKLEHFLQSELGHDARLQFLHCNAHFLLGLSRASEIALRKIEETIQENNKKLGRDKLTKFQRFKKTENATSRLIRTASDILGPRGDEKNGCRAEWLGFCEEARKKSCMTSYRSNRFNSYFLGAAAIIYHLDDIRSFLSKGYLSHSNLKIESVAADCGDNTLLALVCAIALLYLRVTGPFWELLESKEKYTDFHKYVQQMEGCFNRWRDDQSDLLSMDYQGMFDGKFEVDTPLKTAVMEFALAAEHSAAVMHALGMMMPDILITTRTQLKDFLQTGQYGHPLNPDLQKTLDHCPLTNLIGENVFGEMDFDMGKRRHASLHLRSTTQMLRQNRTSMWLDNKPAVEAAHLMLVARRKGKLLRHHHKRQEQLVKLKIRQKLLENERKKHLKEAKVARKRADLIRKVIVHGGPCEKKLDVRLLIGKLHRDSVSSSAVKEVLRDEIRYQKTVLRRKGTLKLAGTVTELTRALELHLPEEEDAQPQVPATAPDAEQAADVAELVVEAAEPEADAGHYEFTRQGEWVAVFYDSNFYIGQVIEVQSEGTATVQYLTKAKGHPSYFRWPSVDDVCSTSAEFVFRWNLDISPVGNNCRLWKVEAVQDITNAYDRINKPFE